MEQLKIKLTTSEEEVIRTSICKCCGMDLDNGIDFKELCHNCNKEINTNKSFYCVKGHYNYGEVESYRHYCKECKNSISK